MEVKNFITLEREQSDTNYLIEDIKRDGWIDNETVIVVCAPEYSSRLAHMINHKLSYLNNDEPFEMLHLQMPTKKMSQVWDTQDKEYRPFEKYLVEWITNNVVVGYKYLFVTNVIYSGATIAKVRHLMKGRKDLEYKFTGLYVSSKSVCFPDYNMKTFTDAPVFFWENTNKKF